MLKNLQTWQRYLPGSKPWVTVAAVLAMFLLLYYAFLGMQYWKFSGEESSLASQISQRLGVDRVEPSPEDALAEALEPLEQRLEELRGWFTFPEVDELVVKLEAAAVDAQVHLLTVSVGEVFQQSFEKTRYEAQPSASSFGPGRLTRNASCTSCTRNCPWPTWWTLVSRESKAIRWWR